MSTTNFLRRAGRAFELAKDILRGRRDAVYCHPMDGIRVQADFIPDIEPDSFDVSCCERLLRAYSRAVEDRVLHSNPKNVDIWTTIAVHQRNFFEVLESKDPARLAAYLCNMSRHDATHGTVQGEVEYRHLKRSARYRNYIARMAKDKLISLAEAVDAIPCENPEQGTWGLNSKLNELILVRKIEESIGISIAPPPIDGGLFKIGSDPYRFGERDCNAIYTAWLIRELLPIGGRRSVCEIGGGVGRVAYWAARLGLNQYTLLDLPHINVLQGFYLLKTLPGANICLYGESDSHDVQAGISIRVLPGYTCRDFRHKSFDLVLNQDSFPEIHADVVLEYLQWMKLSTVLFLSINHESQPNAVNGTLQNNVSDLIARVGDFSRQFRHPYWLRRGYVTELYRI